jgi:hypothetical protein
MQTVASLNTQTPKTPRASFGGKEIPFRDPLAQRADAVFAQTSPYPGAGFRNHCQRLYHFATMLMERDGLDLPAGVAYAVAMTHDLGLVSEKDQGDFYLQRSLALFRREFASADLQGADPGLVEECLLYNHRLLPVPNLSPVAEAFRQAVQLEHGRGLITYGLDRDKVKAVHARYPREDFDWVLLDFARRVITREPKTIIDGIFF